VMYTEYMKVDEVKQLYYVDKLTAREIGERLHVTVWQVIKFMKKHDLPRRRSNESWGYAFSRKPLSFLKKQGLDRKETELLIAGLMLYWAEGTKTAGVTVDLANSDPKMIVLFLTMLRHIYRVDESRLRVLIYCYSDQNVEELSRYWQRLLKIPKKQFIKPYIKQVTRISKRTMTYGLVHVRYNDKRLFAEIHKDIAIIADGMLESWDGRVDKYTSL
jgi:hypothetical protein